MRRRVKKRQLVGLALVIASFAFTLSPIAEAQKRDVQKRVVRGDTLYTLLKPGDIPAIFDPEFVSITEALEETFVADTAHPDGGQNFPMYIENEPLMVVVGKTEVKAYSTWHLDAHEIVNDFLDGTAIAVTW